MKLYNEPVYETLDTYLTAIKKIVEIVSNVNGVLSIYQIGGVRHPGISDIDIVVVFEDGVNCKVNFVNALDHKFRKLFAHGLFATSRSLFMESGHYTFFHNFNLLWGKEILTKKPVYSSSEIISMKQQWAKEFLTRMLINLFVEERFKILNVRGLLLHSKALIYDFEFLEASSGKLKDQVELIMDWRDNWFDSRPASDQILKVHRGIRKSLSEFISENFDKNPMYFPSDGRYQLRGKMKIFPGKVANCQVRGIRFPWVPKKIIRYGIAMQRRLNKFEFTVPGKREEAPKIITESINYTDKATKLVLCEFPFFVPFASNLYYE